MRCDGAGRIPFLAGAGVTPGLASRLSARLLKEFGSPEEVFRAALPHLERYKLPAMLAQAVYKKQSFKRAEKELASTQRIDGNVEVLVQPSRSCGYPQAYIIWDADGGAVGTRDRGSRPGGGERYGAWG